MKINWIVFTIIILASAAGIVSAAEEDDATEFVIPDGVTEIGDYAFVGYTSLESVTIPDTVTRIGSYAFKGCTSLTSVTIPDSVKKIMTGAFEGCTSLTSVTIPDSVTYLDSYTFDGCTSLTQINVDSNNANYASIDGILYDKAVTKLIEVPCSATSITIPSSVTSIRDMAFMGCTSLTSVTIPDSVTSIWSFTFRECTSLARIDVDSNNTKYASIDGVLYNKAVTTLKEVPCSATSITIPGSVTSIDESAFLGCPSLRIDVDSSNTAFTLIDGVLYNKAVTTLIKVPCSATSVTIPSSVTSIGGNAFYSCTSLTSITLPEGLKDIQSHAFYSCTSLTSITIPGSVTNFYNYVFEGCTSLARIDVDSNSTRYASIDGVLYDKAVTTLIEVPCSATSVTIPGSVTSIRNGAFRSCTSLTSITLSEGFPSIGQSAFEGCTSLTSITIPGSVTSISINAFYSCTSLARIDVDSNNANFASVDGVLYDKAVTTLIKVPCSATSVTIPSTVTSIGDHAFEGCTSLARIDIDSNNANFASVDGILYNKAVTTLIKVPCSATSVTIPSTVTSIDSSAFQGCTSLAQIDVDSGNAQFDSANGVLYNTQTGLLMAVQMPGPSVTATVTFVSDEETVETQTLTGTLGELENATVTFPAVTKAKHLLAGWQYGGVLLTGETGIIDASEDVTLTAVWTEKRIILAVPESVTVTEGIPAEITVTLTPADAAAETDTEWAVYSGGKLRITAPESGSYTVTVTATADDYFDAVSTINVTAVDRPVYAHPVTYVWDGRIHTDENISVESGNVFVTLRDPADLGISRYGYLFTGWKSGDRILSGTVGVSQDGLTVEPVWEKNTLAVSPSVWTADAGTEKAFALPAVGRNHASSLPDVSVMITASGVPAGIDMSIREGKAFVTAENPGTYSFKLIATAYGYFSGDGQVTLTVTEPYTVVYMDGDRFIGKTVAGDDRRAIIHQDVSRDGYALKGWATAEGGKVAYSDGDAASVPESGLTLYAVWEKQGWDLIPWAFILIGIALIVAGYVRVFPLAMIIGAVMAGAGTVDVLGWLDLFWWAR